MIIGAQMFTVREHTQTLKKFEQTIKKLHDIGYRTVQISAVGNIGWANIKKITDDYGMEIIITHTDPMRILDDTDMVIEEHRLMGCHNIGMGMMPWAYRGSKEGIVKFIEDYKPVAQRINAAGMNFVYHNHDFEFEKIEGKLIMDYLSEGFSGEELHFMLDIFWVQAGGADPIYWINKYKGRMTCIHFKDFAIVGGQRRMAEVMCGNLNWNGVIAACKEAEIQYAFVEQDDCYGVDPFVCMKTSFDNLNNLG